MSEGPPFRVDRVGVAAIALAGVVVVPGIIALAGLRLVHWGDWAAVSWLEWVAVAGAAVVFATIVGMSLAELSGMRVQVSESGVGAPGRELAWTDVESVDRSEFGVVEVRGKGKKYVLKSYLFRERAALEAFIVKRCPGS